ncbi:MAG TPA: flagellar hook-associated protein FlgL [Firmicutes bacterium]|jgi:flagellar hook-associated protein 3 FlgL|nr:flagellar hook-associated protein FlgL [Bacillota bacterium]
MRVTQSSMVDNLLKNINNNYRRLEKLQQQIATGSTVLLPSDDPAAVTTIMRTKRAINESAQFVSNADKGITWLDSADNALMEATKVLQRSRTLLVYGANGTNTQDEFNIISTELDELLKHLVNISNTSINGRHIFAGQKTLAKPFQYDEATKTVEYIGDSDYIQVEISPGVRETIGEPGINIFGQAMNPGDEGIFATLIKASQDLRDGNPMDDNLAKLDKAIEDLLQRQASIGTKSQSMRLSRDRLEEQNINFQKLLSETKDLDIAKATIDLMTEASIHIMSLKVGAKIIQPSLVDFLN